MVLAITGFVLGIVVMFIFVFLLGLSPKSYPKNEELDYASLSWEERAELDTIKLSYDNEYFRKEAIKAFPKRYTSKNFWIATKGNGPEPISDAFRDGSLIYISRDTVRWNPNREFWIRKQAYEQKLLNYDRETNES